MFGLCPIRHPVTRQPDSQLIDMSDWLPDLISYQYKVNMNQYQTGSGTNIKSIRIHFDTYFSSRHQCYRSIPPELNHLLPQTDTWLVAHQRRIQITSTKLATSVYHFEEQAWCQCETKQGMSCSTVKSYVPRDGKKWKQTSSLDHCVNRLHPQLAFYQ